MAGGEDQPQQVVADGVVERVEQRFGLVRALVLEFAREFLVLALQQLAAAQPVDGAMLGGGHQPRARVVGHAGLGPAFERGDEGVLREFLGQADVAHHARQPGDEPGRFDPPDRFDGAMDVGRRHGERSDHRTTRDAIPGTALFNNALPASTCFQYSAAVLRSASPFSKSSPIMLSMSNTSPITLDT